MDPLCGTLNYATGSHLVAVNVALRNGPAADAETHGLLMSLIRGGGRSA